MSPTLPGATQRLIASAPISRCSRSANARRRTGSADPGPHTPNARAGRSPARAWTERPARSPDAWVGDEWSVRALVDRAAPGARLGSAVLDEVLEPLHVALDPALHEAERVADILDRP